MAAPDVATTITDMRHEIIETLVTRCIPPNTLAENWDVTGLHEESMRLLALDLPVADWVQEEGIADAEIGERITGAADRKMAEKAANYGPDIMRMAEKSLLLQLLDQAWKDHLLSLDHLRQGINLRAYGQRDPLNEYKREAFELFETMLSGLRETVTSVLCHVELRVQRPEDPAMLEMAGAETADASGFAAAPRSASRNIETGGALAAAGAAVDPRTPRNSPCPCGSGKKYKHCHGSL
jgi:preprotein translocase subunit SecA